MYSNVQKCICELRVSVFGYDTSSITYPSIGPPDFLSFDGIAFSVCASQKEPVSVESDQPSHIRLETGMHSVSYRDDGKTSTKTFEVKNTSTVLKIFLKKPWYSSSYRIDWVRVE